MQQNGVAIGYIRIVQNTYQDAMTRVKAAYGTSTMHSLSVRVGAHWSSVCSPYIFIMLFICGSE